MGASWARLEASWRRLGSVLEASWGLLHAPWGRLGPSWVCLGPSARRLGAFWEHLVLDFLGKRCLHLGMPSWIRIFNRFLSDFASEDRSPKFKNTFNSIGQIILFSFQAVLR